MCMKKSLLLRIRVCVFQGDCVELVCRCNNWNFPLGKSSGLQDRRAGDFLSFFFCPMSTAESARNVSTRKKSKRRRKSTKWTDEGTRCLMASCERTQGDKPDVLINDHPTGSNMNADSESEGVSSPADSERMAVKS